MKIGLIIFLIVIATLVFGAVVPHVLADIFRWLAWFFDLIGELFDKITWLKNLFKGVE